MQEKKGRTARVMSLNRQEWIGYSTQVEGLVLPKNRPQHHTNRIVNKVYEHSYRQVGRGDG